MKYSRYLCIALLISLLPTIAKARDLGEGAANGAPSKALQNSQRHYEVWSGIGRLRLASGESCSGVLLDTRDEQGHASGPGYLLTSGHCAFFKFGSARINLPINANVTFRYFHDEPERHRTYAISTIRWSSLVGTDLALLEIDASLMTLIQSGINPLRLASQYHQESQDVINVGAPTGMSERGLRLSVCSEQSAGTFIDQPGVFPLAMRNKCDLRAGSSGSPMLNRRTNEITGIVSQITSDRAPTSEDCLDASLCNHDRFNYSYSPDFLQSCFISGVFTPDQPNCSLTAAEWRVVEPWNIKPYVHRYRDADGRDRLPRWNFGFSLDAAFYRYKTVRNAVECKIPSEYGAASSTQNAYIDAPIGPSNGAHALCIIGVDTPQQPLTRATLNNAYMAGVFLRKGFE